MVLAALAFILSGVAGAIPDGGDIHKHVGNHHDNRNHFGREPDRDLGLLQAQNLQAIPLPAKIEIQALARTAARTYNIPIHQSSELDPVAWPTDSVQEFLAGYRSCKGPIRYERHLVDVVIPCESDWVLDPGGYHLGLAQFDPATWAKAAPPEGDFRKAVDQGCAVARWINTGIDPGSSAGWPYCWWAE